MKAVLGWIRCSSFNNNETTSRGFVLIGGSGCPMLLGGSRPMCSCLFRDLASRCQGPLSNDLPCMLGQSGVSSYADAAIIVREVYDAIYRCCRVISTVDVARLSNFILNEKTTLAESMIKTAYRLPREAMNAANRALSNLSAFQFHRNGGSEFDLKLQDLTQIDSTRFYTKTKTTLWRFVLCQGRERCSEFQCPWICPFKNSSWGEPFARGA